MRKESPITVLLVEDNAGDARLIREMFNDQASRPTVLVHVESMREAQAYITGHQIDTILLDQGLPDVEGLETVRRAHAAAPHVPLVVLTGLDDESLATQALQEGAQDYLIKDQIDTRGLMRAIRYAAERMRAEVTLRNSEERFRLIAESIDEVFWIVNKDFTTVSYVSPAFESVYGSSSASFCENPQSLFERVHRDDVEGVRSHLDRMRSGQDLDREYRIVRPDGSIRWIWSRGFPVHDENEENSRYVGLALDITKRKKAETELRLMQFAMEHASDGILLINPQGKFIRVNEASCISLGRSREELLSMSLSDIDPLFPPEDWGPLWDEIKTRNSVTFETQNEARMGGLFPVEISASYLDFDGKEYVFAFHRDITERKRAEQTLRESEERFRQIAETIGEVFWVSNSEITKIDYINPGYERVWGRTQESLYENPRSFIEAVHSEDRERVVRELELMKTGLAYEHEYRIVRPDGGIRSIWDRGFPVLAETGEVIRYVGVAQDITDRKRAEAEHTRLLTAIEQAAESVVVTNAEGGIEYVNPAFSNMTGYSREEALGKNPRILKSGKHDAEFYAGMWAAILAGTVWKGEMINRRKDGTLYTEKMSVTPVHEEHGKMTHIVAIKEDVTAGRLLEEQFRQSQKMEAVGRLAAGVAHDFNNLLTVIIGYSDVMLDRFVTDDPLRVYTSEIKGAGERAAGLTRQLLAFSRQQVLAPKILDLNILIGDLTKILNRLIGEDVDLVFNPASSSATVKADPGLLEQVLVNLAVNARDAMPRGGKLTIETSHVNVDESYRNTHFSIVVGPYIILAVSDTGCGMDKDTQARIFEPFFTTKEQGKGTGLGLATVHGIVKQSGGSIWVYSEPGAGTTFKVYLPAVEGACEVVRKREIPAGGAETVLLVEDDASLRGLARMVLEVQGGYKVLESSGGKEARLFATQHEGPIHLLLTDVVMPGVSGRELGEDLVTLRSDMRILYMSGYTDDTVVRHGVLERGMAFLQKPFTADSLLRKVREVLDSRPQA